MSVTHEHVTKFDAAKQSALVQSLIIDAIGMTSYLVPALFEVTDLAVAPFLAIWIATLHRNYLAGGLGLAEELLPFTDFVPTATITWYYRFVADEAKTRREFQ